MAKRALLVCLLAALGGCAGASYTPSNAALEANMAPTQQIDRSVDRMQVDQQRANSKSACFAGIVESPGAVGGPLEGVHVQVRHERDAIAEATTDFAGRFHACVLREKANVGEQLAFGSGPYRNQTVHVTLTFSREGRATRSVGFEWDTATKPRTLEITLDKE